MNEPKRYRLVARSLFFKAESFIAAKDGLADSFLTCHNPYCILCDCTMKISPCQIKFWGMQRKKIFLLTQNKNEQDG